MRLYLKKQCLEMLDTLDEAADEIERLLTEKDGGTVLSLLEQCQESAITIGNAIDSACLPEKEGPSPQGSGPAPLSADNETEYEGLSPTSTENEGLSPISTENEGLSPTSISPDEPNEGATAVHALEVYCELVYQVHEAVAGGAAVNEASMLKKLRGQTLKCRNELKNSISTQREVVFLPYKASMWDSLEGFWRREGTDPDTKTVVIPIPYFDKKSDGSFGAVHYEGDQYPDEVPVVNYSEYDFAQRHPDRIYIHNPYDDENFVTSVHPYFYSSHIRQFTDDLVYVPYFVLADPATPDDMASLSGIINFACTQGVLNADHVILQSEAMRRAYITVLVNYSANGEAARPYWEAKISGAGSSKIEKAENLRRSDYVLPAEWEALVTRPDGTKKKTILYNTSVTTMLGNNEAYLTKIADVLNIFRNNQDKATLWWRPHPLMEATLASMRPQLAPRYAALVEQYRAEGWGIFDDTADLDRAIACSDAYYGDPSSLVTLYSKTKKPIMIENCAVLEGSDFSE